MGQNQSVTDPPAVVAVVRLLLRAATRAAGQLSGPFAAIGHRTARASRLEIEMYLLSRVAHDTADCAGVPAAVYRGYFRYRVGRLPAPQDESKPAGFVARLGERFRTYAKASAAPALHGLELPMELVLCRFIVASGDAVEPTAAYGLEARPPDGNDLRRLDTLFQYAGRELVEFGLLVREILIMTESPLTLLAEEVDAIARRVRTAVQAAASKPPPLPGKPASVQFPLRLGPFVRGEVTIFPDEQLGQTAPYAVEGMRPAVTLYVYPGDVPADEPDRLRAVRRELTRATEEAVTFWQSHGLVRPKQTPGRRAGVAGASDWMITYLEPAGGGEIGSVVAIAARGGSFVKCRLTYPLEDQAMVDRALPTFLDAVGEARVGDRREGQAAAADDGSLPAVEAMAHVLLELTPAFQADLVRVAESDFRPGATAAFELRTWFIGRMINVAQACDQHPDVAAAVFGALAEPVAARTPGAGGPAAALGLVNERIRHYQQVTHRDGATARDELGLVADYLLGARSADVPEAFNGWPPRPNDADRSALIAALIAADRNAGRRWLAVCQTLFSDAVPLVEMSTAYVVERLNQLNGPPPPRAGDRSRTYDLN